MRHPLDPDVVPDSKATAVLALGVVAVLTGPLIGGVVPATIALVLARQARTDLRAAGGFLSGARRLRTGTSLAWSGIILAAAALVIVTIIGLLGLAAPDSADYGSEIN